MSVWAGLGGVTRNACVALCTRERVLGICGQERITRVSAAGFNATGLPDEALDELLRATGKSRRDITACGLAETAENRAQFPVVQLDHHFAHACSAFLPSSFDSATVVVCDHEMPQVSVWDAEGTDIRRVEWPWQGLGFANVYSMCAEALGFGAGGREQRLEALARLNPVGHFEPASRLFRLNADHLELEQGWQAQVAESSVALKPFETASSLAAALQARLGDLVIDFLSEVRRRRPTRRRLCVGGSLFYNSYINARVRCSGAFDEVFVPIDPGNSGLAVGGALHVSGNERSVVTPFLGPSYGPETVKATLDNCKLTYDCLTDAHGIAFAVDQLRQGRLVAWFDGPMEWGPRALGARSILASPFSPYVLDNLNRFLKHRDTWRGYALSGLESAIHDHFEGPPASPYMECDYRPKDRDKFRYILPGPQASVRVQTVGQEAPRRFRALLHAFGEATGVPVLVNTSFNGFREPIVCSPRDAVRVFYGSGIDTLMLGEFVINK